MNRRLVVLGVALILLGLTWNWLRRVPLFRLPGDIVVERAGFRLFFPLTTLLPISVVLSIIAWAMRK